MFHNNMKGAQFKRSLLAMSIITLGSPSLALAQAAATPAVENVEEIVVSGIRGSLESAQEIKRNADTVKDVITASDIGALPDKSVTEALQRVPGVTIGRFASASDPNHFAAEGRGVLIRGLDRVHSQFNGRESISAGNWSSGLSFEDIPPELLNEVEVVKNQTSNIISGGIAGTVNLVTRKPFDSDGRKIFVSVKDSYGDLVDKFSPSFSGLYSDRWDTSVGDFGFLIAGSSSKFNARGDGMNLDNFNERSANQTEFPGAISTALIGHETEKLFMPVGLWLRTADSDRDRKGIDSSLQWKNPDDTVKLTAEFISSKSIENWREHVIFPTDNSQGFLGDFVNAQLDPAKPATFDSNGFFTSGTITYPWNTAMLASVRGDHTESNLRDSSFKVELTPTDSLKIQLDAQHLNTSFHRQNNSINNRFSQADVFLDLRGSKPKVEFLGTNASSTPPGWLNCPTGSNPGTTDLSDPSGSCNYYQVSIMDTNVDAEGTLNAFTADLQYEIDATWLKSVSGGAYFSDIDRTTQDDDYANWGNVSNTWGQLPKSGLADHPELAEAFTFDKSFLGGGGLTGANRTFLFPKMSNTSESSLLAYDQYLQSKGISDGGWKNRHARKTIDGVGTDAKGYLPFETVTTKLKRQEEYIRFDFANEELAMPIKANLGLRYVSYGIEATGTTIYDNTAIKSQTLTQSAYFSTHFPEYKKFFDGNGSTVNTEKPEDYTTTLPSFNLSVSVTDDVIARVALSKAIYFPSLYDIRNTRGYSLSVLSTPNDGTVVPTSMTAVASGKGGNPNLKPEESNQLDLTAEWYYNKSTSLTFSAFYKSFDNLFRERNALVDATNPNAGVTIPVIVRQQVNEGKGKLSGFEVAYQQFYDFLPGPLSGLGAQMNYTYVKPTDLADQDAGSSISVGGDRNQFRNFTGLALPGLSKNSFNIAVMYQHSGVEARVAYNLRSEYLVTRHDSDSFAPIYAKDSGYMDASVWYTINEHFRVGLEGSNLLNEETRTTTQFNQEGVTTGKTYSLTDRRYALSLRATF